LSRQSDDSRGREKAKVDLAKVVKYVGEVGPRINQVARLSHQYRESVRYRYRKYLLEKGLAVQASPNYSRLGFTRLIAFVRLPPALESHSASIFTIMSDDCFLHSYTRTLLSHEYICHLAAPRQLRGEVEAVFRRLHDIGLFAEVRMLEFEQIRNPPMKAEYYDFGHDVWNFDWPQPDSKVLMPLTVTQDEVAKYDKTDLLILKELEIDANRSLVKMAANVKLNVKQLDFHYLKHVRGRRLVRSYNVGWQGSRVDYNLGKVVTKKEHYVEVTVILEEASKSEIAELMTLLNALPFLWSEAFGPSYCAELFIPPGSYIRFLEYLEPFAGKVGDKMKTFVMDQTRALRYTISYKLFDESSGWRLDANGLAGRFGEMVSRAKLGEAASR